MQPAAFFVREDDADGLEEGIDYGGADELHPTLLQIFGDGVGQGRGGLVTFTDGDAIGEVPDVVVERAELALYLLEHLGVADGSGNLQTVADDAFVAA